MGVNSKVLRIACGVMAIVALLRLWDIVVLRRFVETPAVPAIWLGAILVLVAVAGRLSAVSPAPTTVFGRAFARLRRDDVVLVAFGLLLVFLFHVNFDRAASDGREYFVQVRSLVLDGDLDFRNENAVFGVRGTAGIYPFGAALLWAPFFIACHGWLAMLNLFGDHQALTGFGNAYQRAIGFGTVIYGWVGFVLVYRILVDYFRRSLAALVVLAVCFGSFYAWYLTIENSMVHGVAMFSTTLFLYLWHRGRVRPTFRQWAVLGAAAALMAMVRWQNVAFLAVPVAYSAAESWRRRNDPAPAGVRLPSLPVGLAVFATTALIGFSPQLIFWHAVRGVWLVPPTAEHAFSLATLHIVDVLYSPDHGLFTWTPLLYLGVLGLPLFFRRDRPLAAVLVAGFIAQVIINSGVGVWGGGAGFGARRFESCALAFAVGLASLLEWFRRRPLVLPTGLVAALVFGNWLLMLDFRSGKLPVEDAVTFDSASAAMYKRVGNPFSFPFNAWFAWRFDADPALYERLKGAYYFNLGIDFGTDDASRFLGHGWSAPDRINGIGFRWSIGPSSSVVVPLKAAGDYQLDVRCAPFSHSGPRPQTLEVVVNGTSIRRQPLSEEAGAYVFAVPAAVTRGGLNQIAFRYGSVQSPANAGLSDDTRLLGVRFETLRLKRK